MYRASPDGMANFPLNRDYPYALLIEIEAYDEDDEAGERLMSFIEAIGDHIEVSLYYSNLNRALLI